MPPWEGVQSAAPEGFSVKLDAPVHTLPGSLGAAPHLLVSIIAIAHKPTRPAPRMSIPPGYFFAPLAPRHIGDMEIQGEAPGPLKHLRLGIRAQ